MKLIQQLLCEIKEFSVSLNFQKSPKRFDTINMAFSSLLHDVV